MPQPTIIHGDCLQAMKTLPDNSVDSIVTDPPYGLGFMGKAWDQLPPGEDWASECLRVLKPGGHLLAFGGTRTWHRLAVSIEDAGFEIRDSIFWHYGSGFPKSLDVAKAVAKTGGDADKWQGWGTALKPATEPVVMARKPLTGTVAANVLEHGTGALNIDACRIEGHVPTTTRGGHTEKHRVNDSHPDAKNLGRLKPQGVVEGNPLGRWPANVVLDETAAGILDQQSGPLGRISGGTSGASTFGDYKQVPVVQYANEVPTTGASRFFGVFPKEFDCCENGEHDTPFKYVAKAPKRERPVVDGVAHPTVKPLALMRWLVKLVTPPGGVVLDPFAGSGTTVEAALGEGFEVIGIEREAEYLPLIQARIDRTAA